MRSSSAAARFSRNLAVSLILAIVLSPGPSGGTGETTAEVKRVRFHIVTVEEAKETRHVISEATVDGPPGTDFEIELRGTRFKMIARFLTDSVVAGAMELKAKLETRRLYGYSERDLPLYEEDAQSHDLSLDLQEKIVLLPFGRPTSDERLAIEITPSRADRLPPFDSDLQIDILQPSPDGSVQIRAFRVAHRFDVTAKLLRDGFEVARGNGECRIEDSRTITLRPADPTRVTPIDSLFDVTVGVRAILRERPVDLVDFEYRIGTEQGSAITPLGLPLEIAIPDPDGPGPGRNHVLRIRVQDVESEASP